MNFDSFFSELKQRNIYSVAIAYAITAWLIAQIAHLTADSFNAPDWVMQMLITVLLIGFPIAIILAWAHESRVAKLETKALPSPTSNHLNRIIIAVLSLSIAFLLLDKFYFKQTESTEKDSISKQIDHLAIAVLPFRNLSSDQENQYFADGIMDAIISRLSNIAELTVIPRTSVERYRNTDKRVSEIGQELKVSHILEASVRKSGSNIRIIPTLLEAATEKQNWTTQYVEKQVEDLFDLETEIAKKIANQLSIQLSPIESERLEKVPTNNLEAYDLYLRAKESHLKYLSTRNEKIYYSTMDLLNRTLKIDPKLSEALSLKSLLYYSHNYDKEYLKEYFMDSVKLWCDLALKFDPENVQALGLLGSYYQRTGQSKRALNLLQKALSINPNSPEVKNRLGTIYAHYQPDFIKSITLLSESIITDPYNPLINSHYIYLILPYLSIGDFVKAEKIAKLALSKVEPESYPYAQAHHQLCHIYLTQGDSKKGLKYAEEWAKINELEAARYQGEFYCVLLKNCENGALYYEKLFKKRDVVNFKQRLAYAYWDIGKKNIARSLFNEYLNEIETILSLGRRPKYGRSYDLAGVYATMGNLEKAMEYIREWDEFGWTFGSISYIDYDRLFDNLRDNKEFKELVKNAKLKMKKIKEEVWEMEKSGEIPSIF